VTGRRGDGDTERLIDGETGRDLPASERPGRVCEGDREVGILRDWERPDRVFPKGCLWQENLPARRSKRRRGSVC